MSENERHPQRERGRTSTCVRERERECVLDGIEIGRVVVVVRWRGGKECVKGNTGLGGAGCARKGVTVSEGAPRGTGRS
jgi:hypothetical protein